jgi:pyridoxine kinase
LFHTNVPCSTGNHTAYRRVAGTKTPAPEILSLWSGLKAAHLTDFNILLSGYCPSAAAVEAVGKIGRELRLRSQHAPGEFFWVLDPVMGDQGKLYVAEETVEVYRGLVGEADLVLPNQFELEVLLGLETGWVGKRGVKGCVEAVGKLHEKGLRHVLVTSIRVDEEEVGSEGGLLVVGSTSDSHGKARCFVVRIPKLDCFFSGTGDMLAGLMVARLREECSKQGLLERKGWVSDDGLSPTELPLAKAAVKVLSSMQMVLEKTMKARDEELARFDNGSRPSVGELDGDQSSTEEERRHLAATKAAEVRVVQNAADLRDPELRYQAEAVS